MVILEIDPAESLTLHLRIFHERDPVVIMNLGKMYTITSHVYTRNPSEGYFER